MAGSARLTASSRDTTMASSGRFSSSPPTIRMSPLDVSVRVLEQFDGLVSVQRLRRIAEHTLAAGLAGNEARLSVVVADDEVVRDLNKRYRGLDENTDVLSFSFTRPGEYYGESGPLPLGDEESAFVLPPGEEDSLGEVIISYPQAQRQADQSGHQVEEEMALLLAHGILHLLGHDHAEPEEEAAMKALEDEVLAKVREDD